MNSILTFFQSEAMIDLVTALLHTLWQGVLVAGLVFLALRAVPARHATARYAVSLAGLALVVLAGFATWSVLDLDLGVEDRNAAAETVVASGAGEARAGNEEGAAVRAGGTPPSPAPAPAAPDQGGTAWRAWLGGAWILGAVFMLFRAAISIRGATRLRRRCLPLEDRELERLIEELRAVMGLRRKVRILVGDAVSVPAVVGVVVPSLLLPAAVLRPLSPEQVRMVIAHELAHIRRYDYLVNLLQFLVEALLFFNPAVWWISRQARLEREACCDVAAVEVTGQAGDYAQTLAEVARVVSGGAQLAAAAALLERDAGTLVSRVRRLLYPAHRPRLRLPWPSAAAVLGGSALVLIALQICTSTVVRATAEWLSPKERIEKITKLAETHTDPTGADDDYSKLPKVTIRGTISASGGTEVPADWEYIHARVERRHATIHHSLDVKGSTFEGKVTPGEISLSGTPPGHAPVFVKAFLAKPGETVGDLHIRLEPGFPARLKVVDPAERPIEGVRCRASFRRWGLGAGGQDLITNSKGEVVVEHASSEAEFVVSLRAPGYQFDKQTFRLEPKKTAVVKLQRARPVKGRVTSEQSEAVAGATIRLAARRGFAPFTVDPRVEWNQRRYPSVEAGPDGRFRLDSLRDDSSYVLYVEAPNHTPKLVPGVRPGQTVTVVLGPPREIRLRLRGDLGKLKRSRQGTYRVPYHNPLRIEDMTSIRTFWTEVAVWTDVAVEGEEGEVHIRNLLPGEVTINLPGRTLRFSVEEPQVHSMTVDLSRPEEETPSKPRWATRSVAVELRVPPDAPVPEGELRVDYVEPGARSYKPFRLPLEKGRVAIDVPLPAEGPGKFRYGPLYANGYWVVDRSEILIYPGEDPLVFEVDAHPAGALYGRVLNTEGEPTNDFHLALITVERPATPDNTWPANNWGSDDQSGGKFLLQPIPLGGVYCVTASDGRNGHFGRILSAPVRVDAANPVQKIDLKIPRGVDVPVEVRFEGASVVAGAKVSLHYDSPYSHSFGSADSTTNREGRCVFRGVNPALPGTISVKVEPRGSFCGTKKKLKVNGSLNIIVLERGLTFRGRVIDHTTGRPMSREKISIWATEGNSEYPGNFEALTDDRGRFIFEGLQPAIYRIGVRGTHPVGTRVRVDDDGRRWYTRPGNDSDKVDLREIDLSERYDVRVVRDEDL